MTKNKVQFYYFILIYCVAFVAASILSIVLSASIDNTSNVYVFLLYLSPQFCYIATTAVVYYIKKFDFRLNTANSTNYKNILFTIIIALGMFLTAVLPNHGIQLLFKKIGTTASVTIPAFNNLWDYFFGFFIICLLAPIGEELVFRKVFCDSLEGIDQWKIILLSGAFFSLTHYNLAQTFHQFITGCILAYIYLKTRNITLPILAHVINNFLALFITRITGEGIWNNIITLIISFGIGLVLLVFSLNMLRKSNPKLLKGEEKHDLKIIIGFLALVFILWLITAITSF
ncbi:CPBP family intramembrane metalloprotease [bacterium]|nr:CPBP family intramembrane metalloprotease [bacterium]